MRNNPALPAAVLILAGGLGVAVFWNLAPQPRSSPAPIERREAETVSAAVFAPPRNGSVIDPAELAGFFRRAAKNEAPAAEREPLRNDPPQTPPLPDRFKILGTVTGPDGAARLYLKNLRDEKLHRVRLDGTEEAGSAMVETTADGYVFRIGGERYAVPRS